MDRDSQLALALQQEEYALLQLSNQEDNPYLSANTTTVNLIDSDNEDNDRKKQKLIKEPIPQPSLSSSGMNTAVSSHDKHYRSRPGSWTLPSPSILTAVNVTGVRIVPSSSSSSFSSSSSVAMPRSLPSARLLDITDPSHEYIDPTPDIHTLFIDFNSRFFHNRLDSVELRWSKRMTLCAGLCSYSSTSKACIISLSAPLLSLRPRSDLINTLLHEMIHAWEFLTRSVRDHDGHGPEFFRIATAINQVAGTRITKYHTFHDEVDVYRVHIWRCDGICQSKSPYYGYVRRAMNRPPSARDPWYSDHQKLCGGTFSKVSEPPPKVRTTVSKAKTDSSGTTTGSKRGRDDGKINKDAGKINNVIDNYFVSPFPVTQPKLLTAQRNGSSSGSSGGIKNNSSSTADSSSFLLSSSSSSSSSSASSSSSNNDNASSYSIPLSQLVHNPSRTSSSTTTHGTEIITIEDTSSSDDEKAPDTVISSSSSSSTVNRTNFPVFDIFSIERDENIVIEISDDEEDDSNDNDPQIQTSSLPTNDDNSHDADDNDEDFGKELVNNFKQFISTLSQSEQINYYNEHYADDNDEKAKDNDSSSSSGSNGNSSSSSNSKKSTTCTFNVEREALNNGNSNGNNVYTYDQSQSTKNDGDDDDDIIILSPFRNKDC